MSEAEKNTKTQENIPKFVEKAKMEQIIKGIRQRLNVNEYANKGFDAEQMKEIRLGMKSGISYQLYAAPYISPKAMHQWRKTLEKGINEKSIIDFLADDGRAYDFEQVKQIRLGLQDKLDIKEYANPDFSAAQMKEIRLGMKNGINYSLYSTGEYSAEQMHVLRFEMLIAKIIDYIKEKFTSIYTVMRSFAVKHIEVSRKEIDLLPEDPQLYKLMRTAYNKLLDKKPGFDEMSFDEQVDSIMKEFERVQVDKSNVQAESFEAEDSNLEM